MEFRTAPTIKVFENYTRQESLILDSSRIKEFKRCPWAYFLKYVLNYAEDKNIAWFVWGTSYHKFREVLELKYKEYTKDNANLQEACQLSLQPALAAAKDNWTKSVTKSPIFYPAKKYEFYTLQNLLAGLVKAYVWWEREKLAGNIEVLEVEFPFAIQLPNGEFIGGRGDQLVRSFGKKQGRDFKTTGTRLDFYGQSLLPNLQFALYTYAEDKIAGGVSGQTIEAFFHDDKCKPELRAFPVLYNTGQMKRFEAEILHVIEEMKVARETDMYRKNENSCYRCEYRPLCQAPSEASQMQLLKLKYKHKIWDHNAEQPDTP